MARPVIGRICAICGKRKGSTLGFKTTLKMLGLPNWRDDKAHEACVRDLQARVAAQAKAQAKAS